MSFFGLLRRWAGSSGDDRPPQATAEEDLQNINGLEILEEDEQQHQYEYSKLLMEFQSETQRLQDELNSAQEQITRMENQHREEMAETEAKLQRLASESKEEIPAVMGRWIDEKKKSEELEKSVKEIGCKHQKQLQLQQENGIKQIKEQKNTIDQLGKLLKTERTKVLSLESEHRKTLDAKDCEYKVLHKNMTEVTKRFETENKNFVSEKKKLEELEKQFQQQNRSLRYSESHVESTMRAFEELQTRSEQFNKELTDEKKKSEELKKSVKEMDSRHQKQLQLQQENGIKQIKEHKDTIDCLEKLLETERTKVLSRESEHRKISDAKDHEYQILHKNMTEVTKRLETQRKNFVSEKKKLEELEKLFLQQKFNSSLKYSESQIETSMRALQELETRSEQFNKELSDEKLRSSFREVNIQIMIDAKDREYKELEKQWKDSKFTVIQLEKLLHEAKSQIPILESEHRKGLNEKDTKSQEMQKQLKQYQEINAQLHIVSEEKEANILRQHRDAMAEKDTRLQQLSAELREQIQTITGRWMDEKRKSDELQNSVKEIDSRQQKQLQIQHEKENKQIKEHKETIDRLQKLLETERTKVLSLESEYRKTSDAKDCESNLQVKLLQEERQKIPFLESEYRKALHKNDTKIMEMQKQGQEYQQNIAQLEKLLEEKEAKNLSLTSELREALDTKNAEYTKMDEQLRELEEELQCEVALREEEKRQNAAIEQYESCMRKLRMYR